MGSAGVQISLLPELNHTGFSSQGQISPQTDIVIGPNAGIQLLGNMLRHEI